jgi:hypothetical protein
MDVMMMEHQTGEGYEEVDHVTSNLQRLTEFKKYCSQEIAKKMDYMNPLPFQ